MKRPLKNSFAPATISVYRYNYLYTDTRTKTKNLRCRIGERIHDLRKERHWTQAQLANLLRISQNYLSILERGQGSFTAEHLLTILKRFNVPIDYFAPNKTQVEGQIQNALARQGASHLLERIDIIPSEQLKSAADAIRETLLSADSTQLITGIAPVLVAHVRNLNLSKIKAQLAEAGVDRRLPWVVENTEEAIKKELLAGKLPRQIAVAYEQAKVVLENALASWRPAGLEKLKNVPEDVLDSDIASDKSRREILAESSKISRRWRILSRIQVEDFVSALRAARD